MLPGLRQLLEAVPVRERNGWIANPYPIQHVVRKDVSWIRPCEADLRMLAESTATGRSVGPVG